MTIAFLNLVQHSAPFWMNTHVVSLVSWPDLSQSGWQHASIDWALLAQSFSTDVFAPVRTFFNNFIKSGQAWALIIGFVLGYVLRGLTTYG